MEGGKGLKFREMHGFLKNGWAKKLRMLMRKKLCSGWGKKGELESGRICLKEEEDGK